MRYLVTKQTRLYESDTYKVISIEKSLEMLWGLDIIGLDTETTGFDVYTTTLVSVQMGNYDFQVFIDTTTVDIQKYKALLESDKLFLLQNAKFDLKFFYHCRIVLKRVYDTYLAEKLLWLGYPPGYRSMGLDSLTMEYLGVGLDKSLRGKRGLSEDVIMYGCEDVKYLEKLMEAQHPELVKKGLLTAVSIENEFVKVLTYIEYSGIKLDRKKWSDKMQKDKEDLVEAEKVLNEWIINKSKEDPSFKVYTYVEAQGNLFTGFNTDPVCILNWNSSKQLIPLFEHMGFDLRVKDKRTGLYKKSVEAKVIDKQKDLSDISPLYLAYTKKYKIVTTYGENVLKQINPMTGRIHTNFNQLMDTGRLSCGGKNKNTKEEYINIQNLPSDHETRSSFVAKKGHVLIDCDYTAQEDYVFTQLSREPKLIEFYNDTEGERDGHSFVAKICFPEDLDSIPEEEVKKKRPDLRALAKKAKFSIHYGGNGTTIAKNLALPVEQGLYIEKSYLSGFSKINEYFKQCKRNMWNRGYILISDITGHKMFIPNWEELKDIEGQFNSEFWDRYRYVKSKDPDDPMVQTVREFFRKRSGYERNSLNAPVQGTSAIITKIAGIKYFNHLIEANLLFAVWIVNIVHDEYLVEASDVLAHDEADWLQKCMEDAGAIFCKDVRLKAVPEIAEYWVH
jgi:DNA polymerase I-like protein with 3'-5' exonuclease and polymerase domains